MDPAQRDDGKEHLQHGSVRGHFRLAEATHGRVGRNLRGLAAVLSQEAGPVVQTAQRPLERSALARADGTRPHPTQQKHIQGIHDASPRGHFGRIDDLPFVPRIVFTMQVTSLPLWNGRMGRGPPAANTMQISAALQMIVHARMGSARSRSGLPSVMRRSSTSCSDSSTIAGKEASRTMRHAPPRAGSVRHSRKSHARQIEVMGSAGRSWASNSPPTAAWPASASIASRCQSEADTGRCEEFEGVHSRPCWIKLFLKLGTGSDVVAQVVCRSRSREGPPARMQGRQTTFVSIHRASAKQSTPPATMNMCLQGAQGARPGRVLASRCIPPKYSDTGSLVHARTARASREGGISCASSPPAWQQRWVRR